jgi:hypothetical protein
MSDPSSILTLELTCGDGGSDVEVNLASGYFPSLIKCDAHASKSVSSDVHTIVFQPSSQLSIHSDSPVTLIVGVHMKDQSSSLKLPFSVWAMDSTSPHNSAEIDRVTNTINAFNLLSSYPKDELWKNMPKLHRLAQGESLKQKRNSMESNLRSPESREGASPSVPLGCDSFEKIASSDEDLRNLEQFISKSGRMKMRSEIEKHRKARKTPERQQQHTNRLDQLMDPNHHSDLFLMAAPEDFRVTTSIAETEHNVAELHNSTVTASKSLKLFDLASEGAKSPPLSLFILTTYR